MADNWSNTEVTVTDDECNTELLNQSMKISKSVELTLEPIKKICFNF